MHTRISWIKKLSIPLALALLSACSGAADTATVGTDASGKHSAGWVAQHWVEYNKSANKGLLFDPSSSCAACHGSDGGGGISKVSCFSGSPVNGQSCHAGVLGHPAGWGDPSAALSFHGHSSNVNAVASLTAACGTCHALDGTGSSVSTAPRCLSCHVKNPAVNSTGCVSCHGAGPSGSAAPDRAGAHGVHLALPGVECATCHFGAGTGVSSHGTVQPGGGFARAAVKLMATTGVSFQGKSGVLGYNPSTGKCSAVTCHGGQESPSWASETLDVAAQCTSCHEQGTAAGTPQYNSFYSGTLFGTPNQLHGFHLQLGISCSDCHDAAKLTTLQHFGELTSANDTTFKGTPAATISGGNTQVTSYVSGTCATSCHGNRNWLP